MSQFAVGAGGTGSASCVVLAVDIGGTKTTAAVVTMYPRGPEILAQKTGPTPASSGPEAVIGNALGLSRQVCDEMPANIGAVTAVGIASAGVIRPGSGHVTHATAAISRWAGAELSQPFEQCFGVPVRVLNDVHAHGLGEAAFGVGRGAHSMVLMAIGTGIGGCHVLRGEPVTGHRGAAGHIGHLPVAEAAGLVCPCGRQGHLEALASGPGILDYARTLGLATSDGPALAAAARDGQTEAVTAYQVAGRATGRVIGAVLNVLDVEVVALTGGVAQVGSPWLEALTAGMAMEAMDVVADTPVRLAAGGVHAALFGAAVHATAR